MELKLELCSYYRKQLLKQKRKKDRNTEMKENS